MEFEASIFGVGLGLGLLIALSVWINSLSKRKEIAELKKHLHTQMSINAKGYEQLQNEVEKLKKENENLRITIASLSNKPGRAELKTLHIWDKAIRILTLKSPTFAPAWEMAIAEANKEIEDAESGMKALVRKVFPMLPQDYGQNNSDESN
jgi:predicted  nucleic acid-binding Zn-ribbon protein